MANTLKFGNGLWATQEDSVLAYNDENGNYKPLPFEFERDTNATVVNKKGLIETVGNNIPRIDFQGNNKGALLLEPQSINKFIYSNQFNESEWSKTNTSVSANETGVGGSTNAWLLSKSSSDGLIRQFITTTGANTFSVYVKKGTLSWVQLYIASSTESSSVYVNLANGLTGTLSGSPTVKVVAMDNGWYRCIITKDTTNINNFRIYPADADNDTSGTSGNIYIQYAQLEQLSYPTSYIPTSGGAVTRAAEVCSGAGNDQVINSTEGVLYAEMSALADDGTVRSIALSDGTSVNRINIRFRSQSNEVEYSLFVNGETTKTITHSVSDTTNFHKMAALYKKDDLKFYVNGFLVGSFVSANMLPPNTLNQLNFDSGAGLSDLYGKTKQIQYFNTALTDAELQALTTI